jgi:nucleoid-associated protein YgaU
MAIPAKDLSEKAQAMEVLFAEYRLQAVMATAMQAIQQASQPPDTRTVTVIGGNLYELAVKYYNDALQWTVIADANNLTDPQIVGQMTLIIPPRSPTDTGGILSAQ